LSPGQRVKGVSIEALGWVSLGAPAGKLRTAADVSPGFPRVASAPDAGLYASNDWFPAQVGRFASTGSMRGRTLASFALRPVRVRPATGELEMATRIVVRITTEADPSTDRLVRKRIVPEWEQAFTRMTHLRGMGLDDAATPLSPAGAKIDHFGSQSVGGGF